MKEIKDMTTEEFVEFAKPIGEMSKKVQNGEMDIQDAIDILIKPPFNYPNRRHAWRVLDPGPPTP